MACKYIYSLKKLLEKNIQIKTNDNYYEYTHNKFVIIDNNLVIDGSMNWSEQGATKNYENVLFLQGEKIVSKFISTFNLLWSQFNNIITLENFENKRRRYLEYKFTNKRNYMNYNYNNRKKNNNIDIVHYNEYNDDNNFEDSQNDFSDGDDKNDEEDDYDDYEEPYINDMDDNYDNDEDFDDDYY